MIFLLWFNEPKVHFEVFFLNDNCQEIDLIKVNEINWVMSMAPILFYCTFAKRKKCMSSSTRVSFGGQNVKVADFLANRLLPSEHCDKVGPFVFLDHVYPTTIKNQEPGRHRGLNAHPHRGVATLTYVLSGSLQHFDSHNNVGTADEGGAHWMKAGKGIIHEEKPAAGILHALQFWINLPSINKKEEPEYRTLSSREIPEVLLPNNAGLLKVLLGKSGELISPVKTFSNEFIFHVVLNPKSFFLYHTKPDLEYAVFVPSDEVHVNGEISGKSHLLVLSNEQPTIQLYNPGIAESHAFIFGGSRYAEPIVTQGPFVMNNCREIIEALDDFFEGRYGAITTHASNFT